MKHYRACEAARVALLFLIGVLAPICPPAAGKGFGNEPDASKPYFTLYAITHLHSSYSYTGTEPLDEIAKKAHDKHIDVFIPTDTFVATWSYGIWPFRRILRKRIVKPSVLAIGIKFYLERLKDIQRRYPDMIVIPGVELAPFYRWEGSPWKGLTLVDWHRHMLVLGLNRPGDYYKLPALGNPAAFPLCFPRMLLAILSIATGLFFIVRIWPLSDQFSGGDSGIGLFFLILGILIFWNNWPFRFAPEDQYDRTTSWAPYQRVIDYVRARGGLVFWAHPDAPNWKDGVVEGPVAIQTRPYPEALLKTMGHQGFAIIREGNRSAALPGGEWDQGLLQYCRGQRAEPFWGISELDYRKPEPRFDVDFTQIALQVQEPTPQAAIAALRSGRFYIIVPTPDKKVRMIVDQWRLQSGGISAGAGETLNGTKAPWLEFSVRPEDGVSRPAQVEIIRGGDVIVREKVKIPHSWKFFDLANRTERTFYRAHIVDGDGGELYTNPIFSFAR